jgi:hypothetical protein
MVLRSGELNGWLICFIGPGVYQGQNGGKEGDQKFEVAHGCHIELLGGNQVK